ncbi:MAG: tetratricopeptide repeat protein [Crocinitomicaceae bacterium]|nr:tetratricopeptide repeat protein [Crocinitomicaceae bacterium]
MIKRSQEMLTIYHDESMQKKIAFYLASGIANIGYQYDEKGDILTAIDYYHRGLTLYERIGNEEGQGTCYNNLAIVYSLIGDTAKSLEYHKHSLEFKLKINDLEGVALSYNNIGTIYETMGQNFVALEYYERSLKMNQEIHYSRGIAMCYDNIGDIYFREEVYGKALSYYQKGFDTWNEIGDAVGINSSLNNLANVHVQTGQLSKAKEYGLRSYDIAIEVGYPIDIENSAKTLMTISELEGDYKKAYEYSEVYIEMRERTKNSQSAKDALKKSLEYEYHKIALEDSLEFQKEKEVQNVKIKEKETQAYALYGGIGLLVIVLLLGIRSYKQKQRDNQKINEQKREVEAQKVEIEKQHIALAETHKEISDSISYAKRIQEAILPARNTLEQLLNNGFVYYQPKDVVSGDFYWTLKTNGRIIIAAADCTGHGVPGAMVSVVCHNALNRVVREFKLTEPAEILNKTREIVIDTFSSSADNVKDGMDISLCCWDPETNKLLWAGANNPLYIIRKENPEVVEIIQPDKQPIGKFENPTPYTSHEITLVQGDRIYLFTDGFMDQFGGENGKKYKYSNFRELLIRTMSTNMDEQGTAIQAEFEKWKGSFEQVDDVCVIGVLI